MVEISHDNSGFYEASQRQYKTCIKGDITQDYIYIYMLD